MRAVWWARCAVSDGDVHVRADVVCLPCPNWPVATVSDGRSGQLAAAGPGRPWPSGWQVHARAGAARR